MRHGLSAFVIICFLFILSIAFCTSAWATRPATPPPRNTLDLVIDTRQTRVLPDGYERTLSGKLFDDVKLDVALLEQGEDTRRKVLLGREFEDVAVTTGFSWESANQDTLGLETNVALRFLPLDPTLFAARHTTLGGAVTDDFAASLNLNEGPLTLSPGMGLAVYDDGFTPVRTHRNFLNLDFAFGEWFDFLDGWSVYGRTENLFGKKIDNAGNYMMGVRTRLFDACDLGYEREFGDVIPERDTLRLSGTLADTLESTLSFSRSPYLDEYTADLSISYSFGQ